MEPTLDQETQLPSGAVETPQATLDRAKAMTGSISAPDLAQAPEPAPVTPPVEPPPVDRGVIDKAAQGTQEFVTAQSAEADRLKQLREEYGALSGEGSLTDMFTQQQEQFGIPTNLKELQDIQLQLADRGTESNLLKAGIAGKAGQTTAAAGRAINQETREAAIRDAGLAARAQVLQGNIETASNLVNQAVQLAYQDRTLRNTNLINQINDLRGVVDEQTQQILDKKEQEYIEDQAKIARVQGAVDAAMVAGVASPDEVARMSDPNISDDARLKIAQGVVAKRAQQDYSLERGIKSRQYQLLGLDIDSANQKIIDAKAAVDSGTLTPEQFDVANTLRKEVNGLQVVKDAQSLEADTASLLASLEQENGVGDIAAINSFQRLVVDPGVAVREGDVALLQSAMSFTDEASLRARGLIQGDKLTENARQQMKDLVKDVYGIRTELVDMNTAQQRTLAKEQGIDYGKYVGRNYSTFEQLQAKVTPEVAVQFGVPSTENYLDDVVNSFSQDPQANPFGVSLTPN